MNTREKYGKYVTTGFLPAVDPLLIDRSEGWTYYGKDVSSFIDCFAGISVVNAGHAHQRVIAAASDAEVESSAVGKVHADPEIARPYLDDHHPDVVECAYRRPGRGA